MQNQAKASSKPDTPGPLRSSSAGHHRQKVDFTVLSDGGQDSELGRPSVHTDGDRGVNPTPFTYPCFNTRVGPIERIHHLAERLTLYFDLRRSTSEIAHQGGYPDDGHES